MGQILAHCTCLCRGRLRPVTGGAGLGETETAGSRFAVALATFGAVCVLVAAAAILRPLADGTSVGAAVVSAALCIAAAVAAAHFGATEQGDVARAIADVCAAGSVVFLGSAGGA